MRQDERRVRIVDEIDAYILARSAMDHQWHVQGLCCLEQWIESPIAVWPAQTGGRQQAADQAQLGHRVAKLLSRGFSIEQRQQGHRLNASVDLQIAVGHETVVRLGHGGGPFWITAEAESQAGGWVHNGPSQTGPIQKAGPRRRIDVAAPNSAAPPAIDTREEACVPKALLIVEWRGQVGVYLLVTLEDVSVGVDNRWVACHCLPLFR